AIPHLSLSTSNFDLRPSTFDLRTSNFELHIGVATVDPALAARDCPRPRPETRCSRTRGAGNAARYGDTEPSASSRDERTPSDRRSSLRTEGGPDPEACSVPPRASRD